MKVLVVALTAALALTHVCSAAERPSCAVPPYLLLSDSQLKRVHDTVSQRHELRIAVLGTGSSALAGPDGPRSAYPARLEETLNQKLSGVKVRVVTLLRTRQTSEDLAHSMDKMLADEKPDLVIWQTGTIDAIRRVDPDEFRAALEEGVDRLQEGKVDVILMNMQYSPRTELMIAIGPYVDTMRVVAQQHGVPLFDRVGVMRHWSDVGVFDFYAAGRDNILAHRVHDCIGRAIATLIVDFGRLQGFELKAGR